VSKRRRTDEPAEDPGQEFLEAVRDVQPLPDPGRVVHAPKPVTPLPFQRQQDDQQVLRDSLSDQRQPDLDLELEAGDGWRSCDQACRGGFCAATATTGRWDQLDLRIALGRGAPCWWISSPWRSSAVCAA
jgi:hypothetical protein